MKRLFENSILYFLAALGALAMLSLASSMDNGYELQTDHEAVQEAIKLARLDAAQSKREARAMAAWGHRE